MADRRSDGKDEGPAKRQRREPEAPKHQEPAKEQKLPEQETFGNSFLLDQMLGGGDRDQASAPPVDAGVQHGQLQDFGGIEDGDGAPAPPPAAQDGWFRPRFRKKGEEVEYVGGDPDQPGIPPEDADWLDGLEPTGALWTDPSPQPPVTALEGNLAPWLLALLPIAGSVPHQMAVAMALSGDPALQDPSGSALLGVGLAGALGCLVAHRVGADPPGRRRAAHGLAIAAAPYAPADPTRTARQLAHLGNGAPPEPQPPDAWLARLIVNRIALDRPPLPTLEDPVPRPPSDPSEPLDLDALFDAELGDAPDPMESIRTAALEGCESQARWGVALRGGAAGVAVSLREQGVASEPLAAALEPLDAQVAQAVALLQEIAGAARSGSVPIRGLMNGLGRSARALTAAHRAGVEGLMAAAVVPGVRPAAPEPVHPELALAVQNGRPLPDLEHLPLTRALIDSVAALSEAVAAATADALMADANDRQDGLGLAAGTLLKMRSLESRGLGDQAAALRDAVGPILLGAGARTGLSLLARWEPTAQLDPEADQVAAGR